MPGLLPLERQIYVAARRSYLGVLSVLVGLVAWCQGPQAAGAAGASHRAESTPHIVLVMADDMGWGQTSYYKHPVLKTPNLDAMAANGLRLDRFYAGAPVCSPTRASVLTGRSNMRTGVDSHGYALRLQERTLAQALKQRGYATGHFGKWHLNGMRGPGVPLLASDSHHPGRFGFEQWLSVTNFFDRDPILSRAGEFAEFQGDSSEIVVDQALAFIAAQVRAKRPTFTVIWYGTPHDPFRASQADRSAFGELDEASRNHYGELVAMDRSMGTLRAGLRELGIADQTLLWFCSDNGGLGKIKPDTVGGLRGFKGSLYEGGLRVPALIEWPSAIRPRVTKFPAVTMDIVPTIAEIVGLPSDNFIQPQDGISLVPLFEQDPPRRSKVIPFSCLGNLAVIDNDMKLIHLGKKSPTTAFELYDLANDPQERVNLINTQAATAERMLAAFEAWQSSLQASVQGLDYPEKRVLPENPQPRFWMEVPEYRPFFSKWRERPEYRARLRKKS